MAKRKRNSVIAQEKVEAKKVDEVPIPLVRSSDEPVIKKVSFYIIVAHDNICLSWKHAGCIVFFIENINSLGEMDQQTKSFGVFSKRNYSPRPSFDDGFKRYDATFKTRKQDGEERPCLCYQWSKTVSLNTNKFTH